MSIVNVDFTSAVRAGVELVDELWTSDEEKASMDLQSKQLDASVAMEQMQVNWAEAQHRSIFVAGWRSSIGWVSSMALAYKFIIYPFLLWFWTIGKSSGVIPVEITPPPTIDASELYPIVMGMLGLGGLRTYEKRTGVASQFIKATTNQQPKKSWYQFWK